MPTPIQIQATKLEIPYSLSQLDNKKNEIAALVESLSLTFEGEQLLYDTLVDLGIEQTKEGEQYDSIDVSKSAGVAPVTLKVTEHPVVGLSVDTTTGNAIIAVEPSSELSVTVEPARQIDVINEQPLIVSLTNKNVVSPSGGGTGSVASLKVGDDFNEGLTDELKAVTDTEGNESKLRLSKGKTEIQDSAIVRASTNPTMRLIADNADNPSTGEDMGTVRFTRNFEDPLALDLARAIFADFSERVVADGGTVEGSEECVASELELIVSGEYLINMVDIRPEYTGTLGSTKADLVFYLNDGTGSPIERFRINTDGDIEVKDPSKGIILRSENNTAYRIVVGNTGAIAAIPPNSFKPSITTLPTISGTLNVGETLTATAGNVSGEPTPTQVFQWQRSDNGTTGWADIAGATGTTYLLGFNDEDKYIRVEQTEENILGTATANSVSTTQIGPVLFSGLLDDYPNAAAAYSLRKLRIAYSGSAIKVRRASDNALQDIGFINNELDVASLESFCSGTNGFVQTWYDQSGNGNDATQATASNQPQIVSIGSTLTQGGRPSVYSAGAKNLNTGLLTLSTIGDINVDFFAVMNNQSTNGKHLFGLTTNDSISDRRRIFCYSQDSASTISVRLFGGNVVYDTTETGQMLFNTNYQGGGGAFGGRINATDLNVSSFSNSGLNIQSSSGFILMSGNSLNAPQLYAADTDSIGYMQETVFYLSNERN
jgi:hypothetical protein